MGDGFNPLKFLVGGVLVAAGFVVGGFLGLALLTAGTGLLQAALTPSGQTGVEISLDNTADTQNPLPVVYGGTVLPIRLVDLRVDPANRKDLWIVGAICHGSENGQGITQLNKIWFDNILAVDDTGTVQAPFAGKVQFAKFLGTDAQNVALNTGYSTVGSSPGSTLSSTLHAVFNPTNLATLPWKNSSAGVGVCCLVLKLTYDQQAFSGIPNVTIAVTGNKVYDPRLAFPRSNNSGWVYAPNPALCIADYLLSARYGTKFATSEVDCGTAGSDTTTSIRNMAAFCEQLVTKPDSTTDWRFSCHGALDVAQSPLENLRRLLSSCRGAVFWEAGQARLAIRDVATPVSLVLDENVIVGDWSFRTPGAADAPNIVRAAYPDLLQNYRGDSVQWPNPAASNSYLTTDFGFEAVTDIELPMTVERWRAEQIALVTLKEMRSAIPVQVTCREVALQLRVGDVVPVTHSFPVWAAKPFWVTEILFDPSTALVRLSLVAYDATAYTLDTQTQYPAAPATNLPDPTTIAPPTGVTLLSDSTTASRLPDGSMVNQIKVSWTPPVDPFLNHYLFFAGPVGGTIATYGPALAGDTYFFLGPIPTDELWQVQMVAVNGLGRESVLTTAVTVGTPVLGVEPSAANLILNGAGQQGLLYAQAPSWSVVSGAGLTIANDWSIAGDRSLKSVNAGSAAFNQQVITVATGDVLYVWGWIKASGLTSGHYGVIQVTQAATATFTVLEKQATYQATGGANNEYIGTTISGVEFVQMALRVTLGGTLYVNLRIDSGTGGTVWWDGVTVQRASPTIAIGGKKGSDGFSDTGGVYVPSTETVNVGTQSTPGTIAKTLTIPASALIPASPSNNWVLDPDEFFCSVSNQFVLARGMVPLPPGVTIVGFRMNGKRATTNDTCVGKLYKSTATPGSPTTLATLTHATTGYAIIASSALSQLVGSEMYAVEISMRGVASGLDATLNRFFIDYTMPDYQKGI